jgi:hypothetical protein
MHYITKDNIDRVTGRYLAEIHGENIPQDAIEVSEALFNTSIQMQRPVLVNGELIELPLPELTQDELAQQSKLAVYQLLNKTAQQYDYRNFAEVAQFVNSDIWKAEADGLLAWQDALWVRAYELLKEPITSVDDFVAQLPRFISKPD